MKFNPEKLNHLANELRHQIGPFCSAIHATIALHDGIYFRLSAMNQEEAELESADEVLPQDNCLANDKAPHHLSQELIDEAILEADQAWRKDGKTGPYSRHLAIALVQRMTGRKCLSQGERTTIERAADLLGHYATFINDAKSDLERHPYVPELETTAESLRELLAAPAPLDPSELHIGACITDGVLHANVMRLEGNGHVTLVATAEMHVDSLYGRDCVGQMTTAEPAPGGAHLGAVLVDRETREGIAFYSPDMIPAHATIKKRFELVHAYARLDPGVRPHLTDQDALLLNQAHEILLEHAEDQRRKGNDSAAMGAECSANAVLRLSAHANWGA